MPKIILITQRKPRGDGYKCLSCKTDDNLTIDHILPESKGGLLEIDNLQTLCRTCNTRKGSKLPPDDRAAVPST